MEYPWYKIVSNGDITQGDILSECPIIVPKITIDIIETYEMSKTRGKFKPFENTMFKHDMIILSQACDIEQDNIDTVVLCPVWPLREIAEKCNKKPWEFGESARKGYMYAYHLLKEDNEKKLLPSIVDFHRIYTLPKTFVIEIATRQEQHIRLLPPYREHLSQAFARYFMRVGLPVDLKPFTKEQFISS